MPALSYSFTNEAGFFGHGKHLGQGMSADTVETRPNANAMSRVSLLIMSGISSRLKTESLSYSIELGLAGHGRHLGQGMSAETVETRPTARAIKRVSRLIMF